MPNILTKRVSMIELFYDLVFAYMISQATSLIHHLQHGTISPVSFLIFAVIVIFFINSWMVQSVFTNRYGSSSWTDITFYFIDMMILLYMSNSFSNTSSKDLTTFFLAASLLSFTLFLQYLIVFFKSSNSNDKNIAKAFCSILIFRTLDLLVVGLSNTSLGRLVYVQMAGMSIIAYLFKLIPNVEEFVILLTQCVTVLYLFYYILMFVAFLRLRYQQPNRPRSFKVPSGKVGAWIIAGVGLISSIFGIVLAFYPPAQVKTEVGSPVTYIIVIAVLVAVVLLTCLGLYLLSKKHPNWVNPKNEFAPFTWEIEGLPKPEKVISNI